MLLEIVWSFFHKILATIYTETIKLCPFDVYVCQFQMDERISFKFSPYKL